MYIKCKDAIEGMRELDDESVHLIVTSPPYKEEDGFSKKLIHDFAIEAERVLKPGCFAIVIVSNMPLKYDVSAFVSMVLSRRLKFFFRIVWKKTFKRGGGIGVTYQYPRPYNYYPNIMTEDILVYKKEGKRKKEKRDEYPKELIDHCRLDVWEYYTAKRYCEYPEKLIEPIIKFWSYSGDLVLDPFIGYGTTAVVCERLGRGWIGYENNPDIYKTAVERLREAVKPRLVGE